MMKRNRIIITNPPLHTSYTVGEEERLRTRRRKQRVAFILAGIIGAVLCAFAGAICEFIHQHK